MSFRWPWNKALTGSAEVIAAIDSGFNPLPRLGGGARERIMETFQTAKTASYSWMYRKSPAVRSVVDCIVRNVGQLEVRLYEEVDDAERQPAYDHPAALSLRYPSETVPADQFIRTMFIDFLTSDDAVALMFPAAGNQLNFKWIPISRIQFLGDNMFDAQTYRVHDLLSGTYSDIPAENILHWRGENPDDPRVGLSRLETLRDLIAEDAAMAQANVELAKSGMTEQSWVYRPLDAPAWSNNARSGFEQDLTNRIRRSNKTPVVLEEGMELRPFGVSPKDAQALDLRQWLKGQVADVYGVPRGMVGLADDLEAARSAFYSDCLPPYCEGFTKMLNLNVLVRVYNWTDGCFEFNLDEKHMGDDRITALVSATGRAVMTTNEGRARINLPPLDTGDELVTPLNVIVGDNPKPSPQVMPPQDPGGPPQDGSARNTDVPTKALTKASQAALDGAPPGPNGYEPLPQFHPRYKADLDRQHQAIDKAQALVERHFTRLERSLRNKAATDWQRWDREFADDINKLVTDIVDAEGALYAFKLGGQFDMRRVVNYLKAMAEGAASGINAMIRQLIDDHGIDGAFALKPQHVESAGAGLGANATTWARMEAAKQSPGYDHRVKVWVPDTQRHAEFGGQTVPIGDNWPAGFAPGSAPGCRCTVSIQ